MAAASMQEMMAQEAVSKAVLASLEAAEEKMDEELRELPIRLSR